MLAERTLRADSLVHQDEVCQDGGTEVALGASHGIVRSTSIGSGIVTPTGRRGNDLERDAARMAAPIVHSRGVNVTGTANTETRVRQCIVDARTTALMLSADL